MTLRDIRPSEDLEKLKESVQERKTNYEMSGPWRHVKKDGTVILVEIASHLITWQGQPGVIVVALDQTAQIQAENALSTSEIRFRELAENIEEVFWIYDHSEERIVYISPAYEKIWGRTVESLYQHARSYMESIHPEDRPVMQDALARQSLGKPTTFEYRIIRPDGSIRWIWDRSVPIVQSGKLVRSIGTATDITARKQAQEKLYESENRFITLFRSNPIPIGITSSSDFRIIDVNDAWCTLTGFSREEAIGHTSTELKLAKPQTLSGIRNTLQNQGTIQLQEIPFYIRSGQLRNILIQSEKIELDGQTCLLNHLLDITERKRAELSPITTPPAARASAASTVSRLRTTSSGCTVVDIGTCLPDGMRWMDLPLRSMRVMPNIAARPG